MLHAIAAADVIEYDHHHHIMLMMLPSEMILMRARSLDMPRRHATFSRLRHVYRQ